MTRRQSNNQWNDGIATHTAPKIQSAKIRWKSCRLNFLGSRRHPPHWLSSKGPKYQRRVLLISASVIEGHFEGKKPCAGRSLLGSCSCTTMPRLTGHLQPRRNCPTLFSGSGPVGLPPFPWTEKRSWKVAIFLPTRRSLLPRRPGWTEFFLVACKRATG